MAMMNNKIFINSLQKLSLTFGDHVGELKKFNMKTFLNIQTDEESMEQEKVEADEIDLGFCLIHVFNCVFAM
jgi:hypothetical protein